MTQRIWKSKYSVLINDSKMIASFFWTTSRGWWGWRGVLNLEFRSGHKVDFKKNYVPSLSSNFSHLKSENKICLEELQR